MDRTRRQRWFKDNVAGPERNGFPCTAWTEGGVFSIEKLSRINRWIENTPPSVQAVHGNPLRSGPATLSLNHRCRLVRSIPQTVASAGGRIRPDAVPGGVFFVIDLPRPSGCI